jgi:hypothetical protein
MQSEFWDNVRERIKDIKNGQKWLAETSGVGRTVINSGISRASSPGADYAYAIACALGTTIEELVDGEAGTEYVRRLYQDKGILWEPPPRISDIVEVLQAVDDVTLDTVRKMILPLKEKKESEGKAG